MKKHKITQYIDIENFEIDDSYEAMKRASSTGPDALNRLIYGDTDSSFIKLYQLFENYFELDDVIFKKTILKFDEESIEANLKITKQELIDLIEDVSQHLGSFVNDNILVKFARTYNVSDDYNWLDFKGEFLFSAIYLLMKKVYIYRQIAEKGVLDEKFDFLNIGIKSDKAQVTNAIIQALGKLLLTQESIQPALAYARKYINDVRALIAKKDKRVAIPASLNKLIDNYPKNGETPRAALIYEYLTNQRGLLRAGAKGKIYLLSSINWNKIPNAKQVQTSLINDLKHRWGLKGNLRTYLNVIFIPEEFEDQFDYSIITLNEDAQLVKVLLKPLQQLFNPLNVNVAELANVDPKLFK